MFHSSPSTQSWSVDLRRTCGKNRSPSTLNLQQFICNSMTDISWENSGGLYLHQHSSGYSGFNLLFTERLRPSAFFQENATSHDLKWNI